MSVSTPGRRETLSLRTDNGPCYKSESFSAFVESWGVVHKTSSPRYPESNGMAERSVKTVKDLLRKENSLEDVLLAYRATPLASGFSPENRPSKL